MIPKSKQNPLEQLILEENEWIFWDFMDVIGNLFDKELINTDITASFQHLTFELIFIFNFDWH